MIKSISSQDINKFESRYRARLINSLSGIKSANLIGTRNKQGQENLSIVSSCFHIGATPPLMGMIFRPATVERHTFENIRDTGVYTINHVHHEIVDRAHQTSARYERDISEFHEVGLSPEYLSSFDAPFVKESKIKMSLIKKSIIHLEINKTELVIGEITNIHLDETLIQVDGFVDIKRADSVGVSGLDCYHSLLEGDRYSYAKPGRLLSRLSIDGKSLDQ